MTYTKQKSTDTKSIGEPVLRYGLALVLAWIGAMKFTEYEAKGIEPLVKNSPLMSWMYDSMSITGVSKLFGVYEIAAAVLIASRPISPRACEAGSAMAAAMFLVTPTFLVSTPGWEPSLGGFPSISAPVGQFLVKDIVLLGAALCSFSESRQASRRAV